MSLTSSDILLINATIITGLIILLTLQSLTSPLWEKQLDDFITSSRNEGIEIITIEGLMDEHCNFNGTTGQVLGKTPEYNEKCFNWAIQDDELNKTVVAWTKFTKSMQITIADNNLNLTPSTTARFVSIGLPWVNFVNIIMILPFAISSIIELSNRLIRNDGLNASRLSIISTVAGFVILTIGFIFILGIMECSNPSGIHVNCHL